MGRLSVRVRVGDAEVWNEQQHPRGKGGEFAKKGAGAGGGGEAAAAGTGGTSSSSEAAGGAPPYIVNSYVGKVLHAHGFKSVKNHPSGKLAYKHAAGHTVLVLPPEAGKKSSSQWHLFTEGLNKAGFGISLNKHLAELLSTAPVDLAPKSKATETIAKLAESAPPAPAAQPDPTQASPDAGKTLGAAGLAGYTLEKTVGGNVLLQKGSAKLYVSKTGEWVAETPGHMTKTGSNGGQLKELFTGKVAPGVKNVTATSSTPGWVQELKPQESHLAPAKPPTPAHHELYNKLKQSAPSPTPEQRSAIAAYTGSGYVSINNCLRFNHDCSDHHAKKISTYLDQTATKEEVTLWRGVKGEYAKILKSIAMQGTQFIERGFMSMSTNETVASGFDGGLKMKVTVPAGTKAAPISHLGHHITELEVIAQAGSALKVTHWDPKTSTMHVTIVQDHLTPAGE